MPPPRGEAGLADAGGAEGRLGQGISNNEIAKRLRKLGFPKATRKRSKRRRVWALEEGVEALEMVRVWISSPGLILQNDVDMVAQVHDAQDESGRERRTEAARFIKQQESGRSIRQQESAAEEGDQAEHIPF